MKVLGPKLSDTSLIHGNPYTTALGTWHSLYREPMACNKELLLVGFPLDICISIYIYTYTYIYVYAYIHIHICIQDMYTYSMCIYVYMFPFEYSWPAEPGSELPTRRADLRPRREAERQRQEPGLWLPPVGGSVFRVMCMYIHTSTCVYIYVCICM